jgi:hypothetical protein
MTSIVPCTAPDSDAPSFGIRNNGHTFIYSPLADMTPLEAAALAVMLAQLSAIVNTWAVDYDLVRDNKYWPEVSRHFMDVITLKRREAAPEDAKP